MQRQCCCAIGIVVALCGIVSAHGLDIEASPLKTWLMGKVDLSAAGGSLTAAESNLEDFIDIFDSELEEVAGGFTFTEGPVWHKDGYLLFSDIDANRIYKYTPGGEIEIWREPSGKSNGLAFDCQWRLLACEHYNRRITRTEHNGSITVIADSYQGKRLNSPNDCVVRTDGTIFFTDPTYGIEEDNSNGVAELDFKGVYRVKPGEEPVLLVDDFDTPNGIALSPDEQTLYVADCWPKSHIRQFSINNDNTLSGGEVVKIPGRQVHAPDGMTMDSEGRIFTSDFRGITIIDLNENTCRTFWDDRIKGHLGEIYPANCCFGDSDLRTLYITARTKLWKIRVKTPGLPAAGARAHVRSGIDFSDRYR